MPKGIPVNEETRARAVALMREGKLSRNAIARELDLSGGSVSAIAKDIGHEFDRSKTEIALAARTIDLAVERQEIAKMIAVEVRRSLEDMRAPALMVQFSAGSEHHEPEFHEHVLPEPSFADKRNLMTIVGIGVTKIAELTKATATEGSAEAISYLDTLVAGLSVARDALSGMGPETDPTIEPANQSREDLIAQLERDAQQSGETAPSDATD